MCAHVQSLTVWTTAFHHRLNSIWFILIYLHYMCVLDCIAYDETDNRCIWEKRVRDGGTRSGHKGDRVHPLGAVKASFEDAVCIHTIATRPDGTQSQLVALTLLQTRWCGAPQRSPRRDASANQRWEIVWGNRRPADYKLLLFTTRASR